MPIAALSEETRHLLGSTSIITTPLSLVKELLDNSIDAGATAIEVSISQNTIDKIEVRDNGSGIYSEDYGSLGRRGHTSKLRNFNDLPNVAGTTLGFRGEALASANTLGKVTIITKTSSDSVAALLHLNPEDGGILKQERTSGPVGTVVKVTELYHEIPVRQQSMTKDATKNLDKIKHLLQSYTMAKPSIRLTFKVIGKPSHNWSYSPKRGATVTEAVLQVLGVQLASKCLEKRLEFSDSDQEADEIKMTSGTTKACYAIQAFLWKPAAEFQQFPGHRYCSVDGRPIASTRGTMQKIMSLYTKYLGNVLSAHCDRRALSNAFVQINIECPRGSYDVNVEPAKDQVLFEDERIILRHFEALCQDVYGSLVLMERPTLPKRSAGHNPPTASEGDPVTSIETANSAQITATNRLRTNDLEANTCLNKDPATQPLSSSGTVAPDNTISHGTSRRIELPQKPPTPFLQSNQTTSRVVDQPPSTFSHIIRSEFVLGTEPQINSPVATSSMSDDLSEKMINAQSRTHGDRHPTATETGPLAPIPGSLALRTSNPHTATRTRTRTRINDVQNHEEPLAMQFQTAKQVRAFSMTPEPEILRHRGAPPQDLDVPPSMRYPYHLGDEHYRGNAVSKDLNQPPVYSPVGPVRRQARAPRRAGGQPPWTPPSSVQKGQEEWHNRYASNPTSGRKGLKQATISFQGSSGPQNRSSGKVQPARSTTHSQDGTETRNTISNSLGPVPAIHAHVEKHYPSKSGSGNTLQHNATATSNDGQIGKGFTQLHSMILQSVEKAAASKGPLLTSLPSGDPRAYLLRRQKSIATDDSMGRPRKFRRMKSVCLPLENICIAEETRELILLIDISTQRLSNSLIDFGHYDKFINDGEVEEALDMDLGQARQVEERLDLVLSCWSESFGERISVESHLSSVLKGKGVEIGE